MAVPLPEGSYVDAVRESSRSLTVKSNITIDRKAIERLIQSPAFTKSFQRLSTSHGLILPLSFPSLLAELNLISVLTLLNFASGYRVPLHQHTGRGAYDSIRVLVMSMYLSSSTGEDYLSTHGMAGMTEQKVAELMGVLGAIHVEKPHPGLPGVVVGELGGPVYELVKLVVRVLSETGEALEAGGYPDLGTFVMEALKEAKGDPDIILQRLVKGLPAFRDTAIVDGKPVYIFKKALLLIHAIRTRFSTTSAFTLPETATLPVFSDNVLPSMLVHLGVIDLSGSTPDLGLDNLFTRPEDITLDTLLNDAPPKTDEQKTKTVPKEGPVLTPTQAYILRAAAIEACAQIVDVARSLDGGEPWVREITLPEVDAWLWAGAKDRADYRRLERFVLRGSEFF